MIITAINASTPPTNHAIAVDTASIIANRLLFAICSFFIGHPKPKRRLPRILTRPGELPLAAPQRRIQAASKPPTGASGISPFPSRIRALPTPAGRTERRRSSPTPRRRSQPRTAPTLSNASRRFPDARDLARPHLPASSHRGSLAQPQRTCPGQARGDCHDVEEPRRLGIAGLDRDRAAG